MFEFWKDRQIEKSVNEFNNRNEDVSEILEIDDADVVVDNMRTWIYKKCDWGSNVEKLSKAEKVFYLVTELDGEVLNGGFGQFFDNSSGDFANETEGALKEIGAYKIADIYKKVMDSLGGSLPQDRKERWAFLLEKETEELSQLMAKCDGEYYSCNDELTELLYKYVMDNKEKFITGN